MEIAVDARLVDVKFDKKHKDKTILTFEADGVCTEDVLSLYRLLHSTGGLEFQSNQGFVPQNKRQEVANGQMTLDQALAVEDDGSAAPVFCGHCHDAVTDAPDQPLCAHCLSLREMAKEDVSREERILAEHIKGCVMAQANITCEECSLLKIPVDKAIKALEAWAAFEPKPAPEPEPVNQETRLTSVLDFLCAPHEQTAIVDDDHVLEAYEVAKAAKAKAMTGEVLELLERRLVEQYDKLAAFADHIMERTEAAVEEAAPEPKAEPQEGDSNAAAA